MYAVNEDSPASAAGLQENDIITAVDGDAIADKDELVSYVKSLAIGQDITLTVYRQGETISVPLTVGENTRSALPEPEETETEEPAAQQIPMDDFSELQPFLEQFNN